MNRLVHKHIYNYRLLKIIYEIMFPEIISLEIDFKYNNFVLKSIKRLSFLDMLETMKFEMAWEKLVTLLLRIMDITTCEFLIEITQIIL